MYIVRDRYNCIRFSSNHRGIALATASTIPGACVWLEM